MQEKSPIKKKILKFLDSKGISKYEFYKKTGITRGVLDQNNGMSEDNMYKFLAVYKADVSADWLFSEVDYTEAQNNLNFSSILQENSQSYQNKQSLTAIDLLIQEKDQRIEAMMETIETLRKYCRRLEEDLERSKNSNENEKPDQSGQKRKAVG